MKDVRINGLLAAIIIGFIALGFEHLEARGK